MITIINSSSPMDLPEHNVVALLIEETTNQTESQQSKIIVIFWREGKVRVPWEKPLRADLCSLI